LANVIKLSTPLHAQRKRAEYRNDTLLFFVQYFSQKGVDNPEKICGEAT